MEDRREVFGRAILLVVYVVVVRTGGPQTTEALNWIELLYGRAFGAENQPE